VRPPDVVQDAHAGNHAAGRPAQVHRLAAGARGWRPLHHRRVEAVAAQPVRQGESRDARAGDEEDALLNAARIEAIGEWWEELGRALAADPDPDASPMERFEAIWSRVVESFAAQRPLWTASFELLSQVDQAPEVRAAVAQAQERARLGLAALFHHLDPTLDEKKAWAVGSFYLALLPGVMAQWLIDPEHAPSGRDLAEALRTIVADVSSGQHVAQE
jgi:hypothetical protein